MRPVLFVLALAMPGAALAQTISAPTPAATAAPTATAPAAAAPAATSTAPLTADSPIETLMADPVGKAAVVKVLPELPTHPSYETFKSMNLRALEPFSGGVITDEKIAAIDAQLKAAKPAK